MLEDIIHIKQVSPCLDNLISSSLPIFEGLPSLAYFKMIKLAESAWLCVVDSADPTYHNYASHSPVWPGLTYT